MSLGLHAIKFIGIWDRSLGSHTKKFSKIRIWSSNTKFIRAWRVIHRLPCYQVLTNLVVDLQTPTPWRFTVGSQHNGTYRHWWLPIFGTSLAPCTIEHPSLAIGTIKDFDITGFLCNGDIISSQYNGTFSMRLAPRATLVLGKIGHRLLPTKWDIAGSRCIGHH